jgi:clan AA aspartic protease (TIGR02281 family)
MKYFVSLILYIIAISSIGQVRKISMEKEHGVFYVPCIVNAIPMRFVFDTGASGISISKEMAQLMAEKGALNKEDVTGTELFRIANGDIVEGLRIKLRSFEFAGIWIKDVYASVSLSLGAPLLLGTNVLERFGKVTIDYNNQLILLGEEKNEYWSFLQDEFSLNKYAWDTKAQTVENLEKAEKHRVKLIDGSYIDWKRSYDESTVLDYKHRLEDLFFKKSYTFDNLGLKSETTLLLNEGISKDNPDSEYAGPSIDIAFRVYTMLNSLIIPYTKFKSYHCITTVPAYCNKNEYSDEPIYDGFFDDYHVHFDMSTLDAFIQTVNTILIDSRELNVIDDNRNLYIVNRRLSHDELTWYDLYISTNGKVWKVYVVARRKQ